MKYRLSTPVGADKAVVSAFVREVALAGGLSETEADLLGSACGEVSYYLNRSGETHPLEWTCQAPRAYAQAQVWLPASTATWQAFQACQLSGLLRDFTREQLMPVGLAPGDTSLMRAARAVEWVRLQSEDRKVGLSLRKDHVYPPVPSLNLSLPEPQEAFVVAEFSESNLEEFCELLPLMEGQLCPKWLEHPRAVQDLMAVGEIAGLAALAPSGRCLGGLFWEPSSRLAVAHGPYLLGEQSTVLAEALVDACLRRVARETSLGLLFRFSPVDFSESKVESLGSVRYRLRSGRVLDVEVYYRALGEDPGGVVWSPPETRDWLAERYRSLYLAREIRPAPQLAPTNPTSAFSLHVVGDWARLYLTPIHLGHDLESNLQRYLEAAHDAKIHNVFLGTDLGIPWQAALGPLLISNGFRPVFVRPQGGEQLDLLVWQLGLRSD